MFCTKKAWQVVAKEVGENSIFSIHFLYRLKVNKYCRCRHKHAHNDEDSSYTEPEKSLYYVVYSVLHTSQTDIATEANKTVFHLKVRI